MPACTSLMRGGRFVRSSEIDGWTETQPHQRELGSDDVKPEAPEDNSVMVLSRGLMAHPLQLANWGIGKIKPSVVYIEIHIRMGNIWIRDVSVFLHRNPQMHVAVLSATLRTHTMDGPVIGSPVAVWLPG